MGTHEVSLTHITHSSFPILPYHLQVAEEAATVIVVAGVMTEVVGTTEVATVTAVVGEGMTVAVTAAEEEGMIAGVIQAMVEDTAEAATVEEEVTTMAMVVVGTVVEEAMVAEEDIKLRSVSIFVGMIDAEFVERYESFPEGSA